MYNLNTHSHFSYLKDYLCNFTSNNFDDFIKEANTVAEIISKSITDTNYSVYGFDFFNKKYYPNNISILYSDIKNKVIGDIFELFAGFFVQYFETGTDFGIRRGTYNFGGDLNQNFDETDLGMDGYGIFSSTNDIAVIQVKYRSNPNEKPFTKNVFASLFTEAIIKEKIRYGNSNQRLIFFTNIPIGTKDSWDGKTKQFNDLANISKIPVVKIGYNEIISLVGSKKFKNTNVDFWKTFYQQFFTEEIKNNTISW